LEAFETILLRTSAKPSEINCPQARNLVTPREPPCFEKLFQLHTLVSRSPSSHLAAMPSKHNVDLYEAIRNSSQGVPFEFVTGGVKYRAVLEHKETREKRAHTAVPASSIPSVPRGVSEDSLGNAKSVKH